MKTIGDRKQLTTEAINAIKTCLLNGIIIIVRYTENGQIYNFADLEIDDSVDAPILAEFEYVMVKDGIMSRTIYPEDMTIMDCVVDEQESSLNIDITKAD